MRSPAVRRETGRHPAESFGRGRSPFAVDRRGKFRHYWTFPSLKEYILVSQDVISIESYTPDGKNRWSLTRVESLDGFLEVGSLGISIPAREIYANVEIPPEDLSMPELTDLPPRHR